MSYLRGFIPWIVFVAIGSGHWQWGAPAALVLAAWFLFGDRRRGVGMDALVLECGTAVFFAALSVLALAVPDSGMREYAGALAVGWLALTAWISLAVRRPFTTGIAKRQAPREVWDNPVFLRINGVLTATWAAAFTASALALYAAHATGHGDTATTLPIQAAGFLIPAYVTARYPERARARATRTRVQQG